MAGTVIVGASVQYSNNDAKISRIPAQDTVVVTGDGVMGGTQSIGFAAAENIVQGDLATIGVVWIHNLDATNFVQIGYDATGFKPTIKLLPGEFCVFRSAQTTLQAQADTGACLIEYYLFEV